MKPKPPEVQDALRIVSRHLPYVIQSKDPDAAGEEAEWHTHWDIGPIEGKSNAYDKMDGLKRQFSSRLKWRVLKKNEADAYEQGIQVGMRLGRSHPRRHAPLRFVPENM
jgi:hypothetical protein